MSAAITCASCRRPLRVPESVLGQTVQCPLCLDEFTAEADPAAEAAARAAEPPRRAARPHPVAAARVESEPEQAPLAQIIEEEPVAAVPFPQAAPERPAAPPGGPRRAVVFPVVVLRDPDRVLRGPMTGELTAEGLHLRKLRQPPTFAAVGGQTRYLGANRLTVTVEGREVELAVNKPWTSNYHLARDAAAFLAGKGPFPDGRAYHLPWFLYALPPLFLALPFVASPFGLITDGPLGVFLWIFIGLVLGGMTLAVVLQAWLRPRARLAGGLALLGVGVAAPLLAIPLTPTYTVDPALWTTFTPSAGDFTVLMPGAPPKAGTAVGPAAPFGQNDTRRYVVDVVSPDVHFAVYVAPAPNGGNVNPWGQLPNQAVQDAKGLLTRDLVLVNFYTYNDRTGTSHGQPYQEFSYPIPSNSYISGSYGGKTLAARVYLVNGREYTLAAVGPRVRIDGADVVKFFNSIQFLTPPPPTPIQPPAPRETTTTGTVRASNGWNQLTITGDVPGGQTTITVPDDAQVMIDGLFGRVPDVKIGSFVTVTQRDGKVIRVAVKSPVAVAPPPPPPPPPGPTRYSGSVWRVNGNRLTLFLDGGGVKTFTVPDFADVTVDGVNRAIGAVQMNDTAVVVVEASGTVSRVDVTSK